MKTKLLRLKADRIVYSFDPHHAPTVTVPSGTTLEVETRDAYDRLFHKDRNVRHYLRDRGALPNNPATGPIFVKGLVPGDGLDVTIERIRPGPVGYVAAVPGIGVLGNTAVVPRISRFMVRRNKLWYENRLSLPLRPMVGVIGLAPAAGSIPCVQVGYHGGNLDCNDMREGTTAHFPVNVPGGLLALGDVHASMGFAEVHSGVNIDARVRIKLVRVPRAGWRRPWLETRREVMTLGVEERIEDAIREATSGMVVLLQKRLGISYTEAIVLSGAAVDIRLGQAAKYGVKVIAYAVFPKSALRPDSQPRLQDGDDNRR